MSINIKLKYIQNIVRPYGYNSKPRSNKLIWADKNENLDSLYLKTLQKVHNSIDPNSIRSYPDPTALYRSLSNSLGFKKENIFLTQGSDGGIHHTFRLFFNKNDKIILTQPTFAMYSIYAKIYQLKTYNLKYNLIENNKIKFNYEELIDIVNRKSIKAVFIANSDSPTGSFINNDQIVKLLTVCKSKGTLVFIDEAYHPFFVDTSIDKIKIFDNLIVSRTFSKAWGLAGLRLGYLVGNKHIIDYYHRTKYMYEASSYAITFANSILNHASEMQKSVKRLINSKKYFEKILSNMGYKIINTEGNFSYVNFGLKRLKIINSLNKIVIFRNNSDLNLLKNYSRFSSINKNKFQIILDKIRDNN